MSTVYVRLIGGLGNQLFQYATGRALSARYGAKLKLDITGFETYGLRRYELGNYPIAASPAGKRDLPPLDGRSIWTPWTNIRNLFRIQRQVRLYHEPHFHFDPKVRDLTPPVYLDGYWQSERYFADIGAELRRELTPSTALGAENADLAAHIAGVEAISLHVRRGDYVSNPTTEAFHGTCSLEYYQNAIAYIQSRTSAEHLFVFSDDPDWTRAHLTSSLPTTFVTVNGPDHGYRDLFLMSRCKHHVLANSSFSWWGAWLNPSPEKIVVAPQHWFRHPTHDTCDLIPRSWVRL